MTTINYNHDPTALSNTLPSGGAVAPNQIFADINATPTIRPNEFRAVRFAPTEKKGKPSRFQEDKTADLVLEYYRRDTIYMKRPDAHEGPFLTIFNRDNIASEITQRVTNRNLVVIILGYIYTTAQEEILFREWTSIMGGCGFHRIVFLRGAKYKSIDGLPILYDSAIAGLNEQATRPLAQNHAAAVPSAP